MFFEENKIMHANLQKGMDRWLEQDLQQRGRTHQEMEEMTLNRPSENDRGLFMGMIDSYFNNAFDELLQRTCKDLIQKWNHEGGKREFAIGVILEMLKDRGQLDDEQALKTTLQNIYDWKTVKKLMGLAALMEGYIFSAYIEIIEQGLNSDNRSREEIIKDIRLLLLLQLGTDVVNEVMPAIQSIDDLQELKQVFIAAARAPNLGTFRTAHPKLKKREETKSILSQQQSEASKNA